MNRYKVTGGVPLHGEVTPITNKNSILKLIPAAMLTAEPVILHKVPKTSDVRVMLRVAKILGAKVHYFDGGDSVKITADNVTSTSIPADISQKARATLLFLGPLYARFGEAGIGESGGCKLGTRPIDTHFINFEKLGAEVTYDKGGYQLKAKKNEDVFVWQDEAGVTPTENAIMASVIGKRHVTIYNAACEPHTQDLCNMLNEMGAHIEGVGSNKLEIDGVDELHGVEYTPIVEHLDVGTYIAAAAITNGEILIKNAIPEHMTQILTMYKRLGVEVEIRGEDIFVPRNQALVANPDIRGNLNKIDAQPWPGLPADLLPIAVVLACHAEGSILLHNKQYESAMGFVEELVKMKANILLADTRQAVTLGKSKLKGAHIFPPSIIQATVALFLAALAAEGTSTIENVEIIERRYPNITQSYRKLGAKIEVI
ncbi:UDP-N-acetylglucosamine 1-carboxyvinyltransferase [candidate division WWE3 bacterium]|uniref:UDP-N-acetylglucosamine 1-carboxyvinyltransferase n=1 Tax=candidate division WWE3 bacterium TaxID=2053526 RepID=A0A955RR36_UNCKA|nr:UDP-N-acetylglucosamine 1-carboxyvinyltransferase [candidate division WWE3 bacterium]